jgi:hypothetical protein
LIVPRVKDDENEYANRVYVRTEFQNVSTFEDTFTGDGVRTVWALEHVPSQILSITVDGAEETFGTFSVDRDTDGTTDLDWYYQPIGVGDYWIQTIHRGAEQSPVANGLDIVVSYKAQTGNEIVVEDAAEQATRAAALGYGTGIYDRVYELKDIADAASALEYATAMLARAKVVPRVVTYSTFRHGLRPGQTQTITLVKHDIDGEFVISSVRFREVADSYDGSEVGVQYDIEATSAARAVPHPGRLFEDIADALRGGSDPVTVAAESASATGGGTTIATFLFPGTSAAPETPIIGDDLCYRYPLLPGVGNYYEPVLALLFVTAAPTTTAVIGDIRYIDPEGVDRGSIFASGPVSIATSAFSTTVTAFSALGLVLEHGGHLEADCDQTDAAATRFGIAVVLEVH